MLLVVHGIVNNSAAESSYHRFVIWTQGCSMRCEGCANTHMWTPGMGTKIEVAELFEQIVREEAIEGVTFLGGEPFDQADALAGRVRRVGTGGWSVSPATDTRPS